jgi:CheY-like chemotaxis protein
VSGVDITTAKMSAEGHPETMLVVEDEVYSREALLKLLRSVGFDAKGVGSAEEAIQLLAGGRGRSPNWIVVDVDLPGMCGLELVRLLQMARPEIHPMLLTAANRRNVREFCNQNAVECFSKPLDVPRFLDYLKTEIP